MIIWYSTNCTSSPFTGTNPLFLSLTGTYTI
eukprot:SAG22_NODE_12719_length_431_cov_10.786145_1_plen_30_part_01